MSSEAPRVRVDAPSALPIGTRLGEFELLSVLGVGGFGIVYLAFDHALEREVAVKEYMPASLADRTATLHVSVRSQNDAETFELGRKSFVNEARLLARFDHPSLLKVHRFWEANGTAYMAMPVMRGRTVKEVRQSMAAPPAEAWLRAMLEPLLGAIERLHSEGVYHRDIAPDNIQIEPDGHPVLLDFGAARRVINDKSQTLTAILKPAYAPIEQYAEVGAVRQGPWTDLYALGATMHYLLLDRPPSPATVRAVHDEDSALTVGHCPGCSEEFLRAIDWMLAPRPADRPQSVAELRDVLAGRRPCPLRRPQEASAHWDRTLVLPHEAADIALDLDDDVTRVLPQPPRPLVAPLQAPAQPTATSPLLPADDAGLLVQASTFMPAQGRPALASAAGAQAAAASPEAGRDLGPGSDALASMSAPPVATALTALPAPSARARLLPLGLGLGVLALAVWAALAWWPRQAEPVAADAAATAASAVLPALAPAEPPSAPAGLALERPESAVATVVVAPMPARSSAGEPRPQGARTGAVARPLPAAAPAAAPVLEPTPPADNPVAAAAAPAPASVAPASLPEPPKPVLKGPEARCTGRSALMHFVCMERECLRSEFQDHADCRDWRKQAGSQ